MTKEERRKHIMETFDKRMREVTIRARYNSSVLDALRIVVLCRLANGGNLEITSPYSPKANQWYRAAQARAERRRLRRRYGYL